MRTKNELYQEAMRTVAARRQMARARAEDARAEAEAAIPALRHAEEEVRVRGIRCALAGAAGKDRTEAAAALADAKQKLTALLAQSGRPADALEPRFVCPKCQDTGSVNGRTCECVHKVMQQLRRKEIEALRAPYANDPEFQKYEAYRDDGIDLARLEYNEMRRLRRDMQLIFQDPYSSLNPRMTIGEIIAEPLRTYHPKMPRQEVRDRVKAMMMKVGLLPNLINRYPHEFSGGQCQRIGIARALILEPKLIICDEPVSALDVSIQAQVVNLLQQLQREMGLSLIFIAHDLAVVKHISDRVLVMYLGHAVELGTYDEVYHNPLHPYTKALMSAVPIPDPDLEKTKTIQLLEGELPSPINPPSGCVFRTRCPLAGPECAKTRPVLEGSFRHAVSCLKVDPL